MNVMVFKPYELRFKVDCGDGTQRSCILQLAVSLESKPVKGMLREENVKDPASEFTFRRIKLK
jgi:hypothetical protein